MSKNSYFTTSIAYANGEPHLGFAWELLQGDVLARYARQQGDNVIFCTGTDEHGTKIAGAAAKAGQSPKEFVDNLSQSFRDLTKLLNVSNDRFIRTTDKGHEQRAQLIWKQLEKDIYKAKYIGWYDVKQEEFVPQSKADPERMKPEHPQAYQKLEEENYFFKLSSYTDRIKEVIDKNEFVILPKSRRNEILSVLKDGLEDISVSRPKAKLDWGIPVPGDENQVMYVWVEALLNYLTVLGYPEHADFKQFWPASVQVIGKDILRFHAAIWPAILMSLGLPLPKKLYVHGFINVNGQAMSKSLGTGINPKDVVEKHGIEAARYYLMRHLSSVDDADFSYEALESAYNDELADQLGNAVQRTLAMIQKYQNGLIGDVPEPQHDTEAYEQALADCRFDLALDEVFDQVKSLNQYIDETKPWELAKKGDKDHLREILAEFAGDLLQIAELLVPFLPETAAKISAIFKEGFIKPPETTLFPKSKD